LRLRHWDHRRAAPGRLGRRALQPAPQQRGSTDQRDYSRKNFRQAHIILLLIARTLSDAGAHSNLIIDVRDHRHLEFILITQSHAIGKC
jgi:hypothetical protein